jgi:hypothetical protein
MTFAMIKGAGLPMIYWGYSFQHAIFLTNRLPTSAQEGHATPYAGWNKGEIPSLKKIRTFGCLAMKYKDKAARGGKEQDKAELCFNLGYDASKNVYNLGRLQHRGAITTGASVRFDEGQDMIWKTYKSSGNGRSATPKQDVGLKRTHDGVKDTAQTQDRKQEKQDDADGGLREEVPRTSGGDTRSAEGLRHPSNGLVPCEISAPDGKPEHAANRSANDSKIVLGSEKKPAEARMVGINEG